MRDFRSGEVAPFARGWVYLSPESEDGLLVAYQLPQLPDDRGYQLWLVPPDGRISGGLFVVDPEGYGWLKVRAPRALAGYQRIGITIERRGGSPGPTGPRVLRADL
ncbi:MAG: anti-sigma factor [Chloroflexi bacterium]|nr:anti-sigma factor [Chloroflexota bacterium]